ncbi:hypothetical protein IAT40_006178 [Kwoniella sp. CBS 6097]
MRPTAKPARSSASDHDHDHDHELELELGLDLGLIHDDPSLSYLLENAASSKLLFRVHSPFSNSPLIWTGSYRTSGFFSPNAFLASSTPTSYKIFHRLVPPPSRFRFSWSRPRTSSKSRTSTSAITGGLELTIPGPHLRHTLVDHVQGRSKQTCIQDMPTIEANKDGVWQDERTPWISASVDMFWCIWEIARRLAVEEYSPTWVESVELAIIRHPVNHSSILETSTCPIKDEQTEREGGPLTLNDGREPPIVSSKSRDTQDKQEDAVDADTDSHREEPNSPPLPLTREIWLKPTDHLSPHVLPGEMSVSLKGEYEAAKKAAADSGEILFYGRIWGENILSNLEWTRTETPFPLPLQLLAASSGDHNDDETYDHDQADCEGFKVDEDKEEEEENNDDNEEEQVSRKTKSRSHQSGKSWLEELAWSPKEDEYLSAYRKVVQRRKEIASIRGESEWYMYMRPTVL